MSLAPETGSRSATSAGASAGTARDAAPGVFDNGNTSVCRTGNPVLRVAVETENA